MARTRERSEGSGMDDGSWLCIGSVPLTVHT
jgi:hypothetical protein